MQLLGWTKRFCPVTLKREKVLIPGNKAFAASFRGLMYLCADEGSRLAFVHNPTSFVVVPKGDIIAPILMPTLWHTFDYVRMYDRHCIHVRAELCSQFLGSRPFQNTHE